MIEEAQVRIITKKVLDEEHLLGHIKIFEKEHNLFRGSHDKIQLPAALNVPQQIVNTISKKIKLEDLEDVSIPTKAVGDFIQYNETTEKWTRQAALAEGSIVIAIADGYFSEDNTNFTWDNTSKTFKVIGSTFLDGAVVINDSNADKDFRVEGSGATYTHLLFTDASANMVGINEDAPKALLHIRGATCADYAGLHPDTYLLIENDDSVGIQMQAATNGVARIRFCDDKYNPSAGGIDYDFANDEMDFFVATNLAWQLSASALTCYVPLLAVDIAGINIVGRIQIDTNEADAYYELREDAAIKWAWGYDYSDSFKFKLGEGAPGTNTTFEITVGGGSLNLVRAADKGLQYLDTGSDIRWMMRVATGTNVVEILNRASHGKIELHANTGTAGAAGDVLVATFEDDLVTLAVDLRISNQKELRFHDNGNYVGFEAPALIANQIWVLPVADGGANEALITDGGGNLGWSAFGDVAAAANLSDNTLLRGDGGGKGIQDSGIIVADNDSLSNIGTVSCGAITCGAVTSNASSSFPSATRIGTLTFSNGSIIDSGGAIAFGNENLITTGWISLGSTPAQSGTIRMPSNTNIRFRNAANDADKVIFEFDGNDVALFGWNTDCSIGRAALTLIGADGGSMNVAGGLLTVNVVAGNVGIGVTDPDTKLEVNGVTHFDGGYVIFKDSGTLTGYIGDAVNMGFGGLVNTDLVLRAVTGLGITTNNGASDAFYITSAGLVGINRTDPAAKLDVYLTGGGTAVIIDSDAGNDSYLAFAEAGTERAWLYYDATAHAFVINPAGENADIFLSPDGTGKAKFGTHAAIGSETITGYISIKDAAGNARKLAVVS